MPTFYQVLKTRGLKAAVNFKLERICCGVLYDMHQYAKKRGRNLYHPDYKTPWWFKIVSKLEYWTR